MDEGFGVGTPVLLGCRGISREGGTGEAGCMWDVTVPLLLPYPELFAENSCSLGIS